MKGFFMQVQQKKQKVNGRLSKVSLGWWTRFYRDHCGLNVDFAGIKVSERPTYTSTLLLMAGGLLPSVAFAAQEKISPIFRFEDKGNVDALVAWNQRTTHNPYAVWVEDQIHSDVEIVGNDIKESSDTFMTIAEYLIFRSVYHRRTGNFLDTQTCTLCASQRQDGRFFACAGYREDPRGLHVYAHMPHALSEGVRARKVVVC